jgi:hypothetical protein
MRTVVVGGAQMGAIQKADTREQRLFSFQYLLYNKYR